MRYLFYFIAGIVFSFGLLLSGMVGPEKIKNFLALTNPNWSPALVFVLFAAALTYLFFYLLIRNRGMTLNQRAFVAPSSPPIDKKLVFGSAVFGIGWGLVGLCPGPALVNLANPSTSILVFVFAMFVGFELNRRLVD